MSPGPTWEQGKRPTGSYLDSAFWEELVNRVQDRRQVIGQSDTTFSYVGTVYAAGELVGKDDGGTTGGVRNWAHDMVKKLLPELVASIEFCAQNEGTNGEWLDPDDTPYTGKDTVDSPDYDTVKGWQQVVFEIRQIVDLLVNLGIARRGELWVLRESIGVRTILDVDTSDLTVVRSGSTPGSDGRGCGGDEATIWHSDNGTDKVYELDEADFSEVRNGAAPENTPTYCGGDAEIIYLFARAFGFPAKVYVLDPTDFSEVVEADEPDVSAFPRGYGGDADTCWYADLELGPPVVQTIYTLDPSDLSVLTSDAVPVANVNIEGGGGNSGSLFVGHNPTVAPDEVMELDVDDYAIVQRENLGGPMDMG